MKTFGNNLGLQTLEFWGGRCSDYMFNLFCLNSDGITLLYQDSDAVLHN